MTKLYTGLISLQFFRTLKGLAGIFVSLERNAKWILINTVFKSCSECLSRVSSSNKEIKF